MKVKCAFNSLVALVTSFNLYKEPIILSFYHDIQNINKNLTPRSLICNLFKVNGIIEEVLKNDINVRLNVSIVTLSFIFIRKIKSVVQIYSILISTFEHISKCGAKQSAI